jgi:hypothetical protein
MTADFKPLLRRHLPLYVTSDERRSFYSAARGCLLRAVVTENLTPSDAVRNRLALEEAIRVVDAEIPVQTPFPEPLP